MRAPRPTRAFVALALAAVATLATLATVAALAGAARAEPRFALVLGNARGDVGEVELRWSASDAQKFARVLRDLGGVQPENLVTLIDENADTARRTLIALNERIRQAGNGATLIVYYSGHADAAALHFGDSKLPLPELESLVRGSAANLRLLVVDACKSGSLTRVKGGVVRTAPPVELASSLPADGVVFLTASAANEDAQESDTVHGSFFTHYLISGLVGAADRDGDGTVDVDEAYAYAYERTLRASSASAAGLQHPTYRHELKGRAPFVVTRLREGKDQAFLVFPPNQTWLVFKGDPNGPVLAELDADDQQRILSLHAEKLFLRGRAPDTLLEATVAPTVSQFVSVRDLPLERIQYARLVRKGGAGPSASNSLEAGYDLGRALNGSAGVCQGPWAGWVHARETLSFAVRAAACFEHFDNATLASSASAVRLEARLFHAWDWSHVSLELGGGLGAAWLHQTFTTTGAAPARNTVAGRVELGAAVVVDFTQALYLRTELSAEMWLFERADSDGADTRLRPVIGPHAAVGIGYHF